MSDHTAEPMPVGQPAAEGTLPSSAPAGRGRGPRRAWRIAGAIAGVALAATAFAAVRFLSGGGTQPEDVLPADTIAFAKLDLDPAAGQKVAFARFITRFPDTFADVSEEDPLGSVYATGDRGAGEWKTIRTWLGDRYAVAAVPRDEGVEPVVVLQVTDEQTARDYFDGHYPEMSIGFSAGYLVAAGERAVVDAVVAAPQHLADHADYGADVAALASDQVAVLWADLKAAARFGDEALAGLDAAAGLADPLSKATGRVAAGLHFTSRSAVLTLVGRDVGSGGDPLTAGTTTEVERLPAGTLAALGISGIGALITQALDGDPTLAGAIDDLGLRRSDLGAVFSGPLTIAALPDDADGASILLSLRPESPEQARAAVRRLLGPLLAGALAMRISGDHLYAGLDAAGLRRDVQAVEFAASRLRGSETFDEAVPAAGSLVLWLDAEHALPVFGMEDGLGALAAVGLVVRADEPGNSRATLSVTLR